MNEYEINFSKLSEMDNEKYIGVNIKNKQYVKENRILFLIIDNKTLYYDYSLIIHNLPAMIKKNNDYSNFEEINIICSYPGVIHNIANMNNIYSVIGKIEKPLDKNNSNNHMENLLEYVIEEYIKVKTKYPSDIPINCIIVSNSYANNISQNVIDKLYFLITETKFMYYDFNIINNEYMLNINNNNNYKNNIFNNNAIEFSNFIDNYNFTNYDTSKIKISVENALFLCNLKKEMEISDINHNIIIKKYNNSDPIKIKIYDKEYYYKDNHVYENYDIIKYIEQIIIDWKVNDENESLEYINIFKNIIKKKYEISEKKGDTETKKNLVWLIKSIGQFYDVKINNIIKYDDKEEDVIKKLAYKSENNIKHERLKEKFNNVIINNINMLKQSKELFIIDDETNEFIIKHENKKDENNSFVKSCETFYSMISISNWFDELKNGSSMGMLMKIISNDVSKLCIPGSRINIDEITLSCISTKDYIDSIIYHFDKNGNAYGDLNNNEIFKGNGIGSSNAVIPLYINIEHWKQAKKHIPYVLGIIISHNPLGYTEKHLNFMFYLLTDMTRKTFIKNDNYSMLWIKMYLALLRTCSQIAYEKGYNKGIKSIVTKYITDPNKRLISRPFDNDVIIGQILCTGVKMETNKLDMLIEYIYEDCIRRKISPIYNKQYIKFLESMEDQNQEAELKKELDTLIDFVDNNLRYACEILLSFRRMLNIITQINNKFGGFMKFLKNIDDNYGSISDNICEEIYDEIKKILFTEKVSYIDLYKEKEDNININSRKKIFTCIWKSIKYGKEKDMKNIIRENKLNSLDEDKTYQKLLKYI